MPVKTKAEMEQDLALKTEEIRFLKAENKKLATTQTIKTNVLLPKKTTIPVFVNILDEWLLRIELMNEKTKELKESALQQHYKEYCRLYTKAISEYMSAHTDLSKHKWIMRNGKTMNIQDIEKHQKTYNKFGAEGNIEMPTKK